MAKKEKKVKWGKIGAPKSKKRKLWLAALRKRKGTSTKATTRKKRKSASSRKGVAYQATWILW